MEAAVFVLAGAVFVLAAAVATRPRYSPPDPPQSSTTTELLPDDDTTTDTLALRVVDDSVEHRTLELTAAGLDTYLLRLERVDHVPDDTATALPVWVPRTIETLVQSLPEASRLLTTGDYVVRFSPEVAKGLKDGSLTLMETGREQLPIAMSPGKIAGHARVVGAVGGVGATALTLGVAAAAVGAAYLQQRWLEQTLAAIDAQIHALAERQRDDDHGRLHAAARSAAAVDRALDTGSVPQIRLTELAVATTETHAIYASRRRFVARFVHELESAQDEHAAKHGTEQAWADGALKAFGDPAAFHSEVTVYLQALVVRARLGTTVAAVLGLDGHSAEGLRQLDETVEELRRDFLDLKRRVAALAKVDAAPKRRRSAPYLAAARDLSQLMTERIAPTLPPPQDDDIVIPIGKLDPGRVGG